MSAMTINKGILVGFIPSGNHEVRSSNCLSMDTDSKGVSECYVC